jgi:RNA polymerase sigma factor, sigma-70 family
MKLFSRDNEQTIVRKLNRGDATAIDLLYAEYAPLLTAVCARYVAQNEDIKDILQEAFIKMFDKGRTFNYRGKGSLKAWATRIVINESLLFLRQQAKQEQCFLDKEPPDVVDE